VVAPCPSDSQSVAFSLRGGYLTVQYYSYNITMGDHKAAESSAHVRMWTAQ
jgi:hypothetical protein